MPIIVFLMDPLSTVNPKKDTSIMMMIEALTRGYEVMHVAQGDMWAESGTVQFLATPITHIDKDGSVTFELQSPKRLTGAELHAVIIRTDPPVNDAYIHDLWILDLLPASVYVMNRPSGIRSVNEKIWCSKFSSITPATLITRKKSEFNAFITPFDTVIIKPVNGYGGQGVFKLSASDSNIMVAFETLSQNETVDVITQPFIQDADNGDKRILVLKGEPIGCILRVHSNKDHRNNFFAGGGWAPTTLTERDTHIIDTLKPYLIEKGLDFVGIDIIGDYLIEVNVTSPTCLQEINQTYNLQLESLILDLIDSFK